MSKFTLNNTTTLLIKHLLLAKQAGDDEIPYGDLTKTAGTDVQRRGV